MTLAIYRGPKLRAHQQVGISMDLHRWLAPSGNAFSSYEPISRWESSGPSPLASS